MAKSTLSLLLVLALAALFHADASGLRREVSGRETWLEAMQEATPSITCACSCPTPYGRRFIGAEQDAGAGVLVQLIPIPGSPPEHTQICLRPETAIPAIIAFPFVVWW
jgi:hypothetical protein